MAKFSQIIIGGLEIAAGIAIDIFVPGGALFGNFLIAAGVGEIIGGLGTLLTQPQGGLATSSRNPIQPWNVIYGRAKTGGTVVYINESGENDKYLDMVIVLACHPCAGVDALLFDNQRVLIGSNGNSVRPTRITGTDNQETINFSSITRSNGVVTVVLSSAFTIPLQDGDQLIVSNVSGQTTGDKSLNGKWYISVVNSTTFTYICGGFNVSLSSTGKAQTCFPDYREKVHVEYLLGNQTATFPGMISGTPYDAGGSTVTVSNNPWTADCKLTGRTAAFLRLHYNDEVFASGLPQISFRLRGKNDILDPRTGDTGYTENAALCIADYLSNQSFGYKAAYGTEIPTGPLMAAANICDEAVTLASGATEPRYTCNGQFTLNTSRGEVLQNLLTSCAGRLTYSGGRFVVTPAAWVGTSVQAYTGIVNSSGSPATTATLKILTSHTPGSPAALPGLCSVQGFSLFYHGWMNDSSSWTLRTDSLTLSPGDLSTLKVMFAIGPGTAISTESTADEFRIYDCWIEVTFADSTTGTYRATNAAISTAWTDGTITNQANAIDSSTSTYATIQRSHVDTLDFSPVLVLTAFNYPDQTAVLTPAPLAMSPLGNAAGPFRWRSKVAIRDLYNGVKGTYVSPVNGWQTSDFPPYAQDTLHGYSSDANLTADGGDRRWLDIQLPFTVSSSTAQRLAKIELMRRRQQGTGTFAFNASLYQLTALDVVQMTVPYLGWTNKLLEVSAHRLTQNKIQNGDAEATLLGCEIDVQETDPSVYDWSATEELTPQGFQQTTTPGSGANTIVTAPAGVSATNTTAAGTGLTTGQIQITWTAPSDGYVTSGGQTITQYSLDNINWIPLGTYDASVTTAYIPTVAAGQSYWVRVAFQNAQGVQSAWTVYGPLTATGSSVSAGVGVRETPSGTLNGTNTGFTLSFTPATGSLLLFLNGAEQLPTTDYTITGAAITFTVAPKSTDLMIAWYTH
jgi:hypothetical protein